MFWICSKCQYKWQATGASRTRQGTGCPACAGRVVTETNNMAQTHPQLAVEFDQEANAPLCPEKSDLP